MLWVIAKPAGEPRRGASTALRVLGEVDAPHQASALLKAFERWPKECEAGKPQAGFVAMTQTRFSAGWQPDGSVR
jgi:predicted RNA polymerase sigma factor